MEFLDDYVNHRLTASNGDALLHDPNLLSLAANQLLPSPLSALIATALNASVRFTMPKIYPETDSINLAVIEGCLNVGADNASAALLKVLNSLDNNKINLLSTSSTLRATHISPARLSLLASEVVKQSKEWQMLLTLESLDSAHEQPPASENLLAEFPEESFMPFFFERWVRVLAGSFGTQSWLSVLMKAAYTGLPENTVLSILRTISKDLSPRFPTGPSAHLTTEMVIEVDATYRRTGRFEDPDKTYILRQPFHTKVVQDHGEMIAGIVDSALTDAKTISFRDALESVL